MLTLMQLLLNMMLTITMRLLLLVLMLMLLVLWLVACITHIIIVNMMQWRETNPNPYSEKPTNILFLSHVLSDMIWLTWKLLPCNTSCTYEYLLSECIILCECLFIDWCLGLDDWWTSELYPLAPSSTTLSECVLFICRMGLVNVVVCLLNPGAVLLCCGNLIILPIC